MITGSSLKKQKNIVCIEIGDQYFKSVYFKVSKNKTDMTAAKVCHSASLSEDDIAGGIKEFMEVHHIKRAAVINVIPSKYGMYKNIEIPSTDKKEINQIIDLQAGTHTPYPKNEIVIDYADIGVLQERYTKILLVTVKRDVVTKRYDIIKRAGHKADTAVLAAEVAPKLFYELCPDKSDKPVGIVHMDMTSADFTVVQDNNIMYIRSIFVGTHDIESEPGENRQVFLEELKKSLDSYQANNIGDMPEKIYFTGAVKAVSGMLEDTRQAIGTQVEVVSYSTLIDIPSDITASTADSADISLFSVFAPVMVTSGRCLNLIPEDVRASRAIKKKSREVIKLGTFLMVILVLFCATFLTQILLKGFYLKKLQQSYARENREVKEVAEVSTRTAIIKRFLNKKGEALYVLSELFNLMPQEVYLSSINFRDGETVTFTGTADSMSEVFSLVTELENSRVFKNVKVDFTKSRRHKDLEVADFGLTLLLENRETG